MMGPKGIGWSRLWCKPKRSSLWTCCRGGFLGSLENPQTWQKMMWWEKRGTAMSKSFFIVIPYYIDCKMRPAFVFTWMYWLPKCTTFWRTSKCCKRKITKKSNQSRYSHWFSTNDIGKPSKSETIWWKWDCRFKISTWNFHGMYIQYTLDALV